jgi:hypothetical protein
MRLSALEAQQRLDGPVRGGLTIVQALPRVIGTGTHRYLLLLTNPGEERGGGGFIGAVGALTFSGGGLVGADFMPSDFSDALVTDIPAPAPIFEITGTALVLSDSDWSPNFPSSAELAREFYMRATGQSIDGVINVDPLALSYVLSVLGPIHVPPYPQTVSATNTLLNLNYIINEARPGDPGKAYLAPFGRAVVEATVTTPRSKWASLAAALERAALEKHIVLWFTNSQLESLVQSAGIGGVLRPGGPGSPLLVADSNLSGTKGDLFVQRRFDLSASVGADGHVVDRLALTYHNPSVSSPADEALLSNSGGLYEDYVRVYMPPGSYFDDLQESVNGSPAQSVSPEDLGVEDGLPWVAYRILLDVNQSDEITLVYEGNLATHVGGSLRYSVLWEKQINALPWDASVEIRLPDGRSVGWRGVLDRDVVVQAAT